MKKAKILGAVLLSFAFIVTTTPVIEAKDNTEIAVVYVTKTGEKYHSGNCSYLRKSKIEKSLSDAVNEGYEPCSRCHPPVLDEND